MAKGYTLKVYPAGLSREVYRVIEISGDETLDGLCMAILDAFDFIHEHMYEFCMDNKMYSDCAYQYEPEGGEPSTVIALDEIGLVKGQNFSLHYDFGDDWMFTIHVQKIADGAGPGTPRLLKEKGSIEQYPGWGEDEEDEYEEDGEEIE